jgi:hypothetical protein
MTINKLCSLLARLEKTKSQARIQAIRSIVGHLSDILYKDCFQQDALTVSTYSALILSGKRRARKGTRK